MIGGRVWALSVAGAIGAVAGLVVGTAMSLLGLAVPIPAWAVLGAIAAVIWWAATHVRPDDQDPPSEPSTPAAHSWSNPDRETRRLESRIRGAVSARPTTVADLHATVHELARARAGERPYPPRLNAYLSATPRALGRTELRAILRELTEL